MYLAATFVNNTTKFRNFLVAMIILVMVLLLTLITSLNIVMAESPIPEDGIDSAENSNYNVLVNDDQVYGIAGQMRTITAYTSNGDSLDGKFLLIQIIETSNTNPSVMAIGLRSEDNEETITISYGLANSIIDVWLFDSFEDLFLAGNNIEGFLAFDTIRP